MTLRDQNLTSRAGHENVVSARSALSLIEIMVAVTLLSLIVIGLLAVFNHTTRALRLAHNQTDIFESARAVVDLVERDLTIVSASGETNVYNVFATNVSGSVLSGPGGLQTNYLSDLFLLSRENDRWFAFGYFVQPSYNVEGIGTLYRFATNGWWFGSVSNTSFYFTNWWNTYSLLSGQNASRILDGVVSFDVRAYDAKGRLYTDDWLSGLTNSPTTNYLTEIQENIEIFPDYFGFRGRFLPAFVDLEIGMLEPQATRQFNAIAANSPVAAKAFLQNQLGKIHIFRQRIQVRNHMKPEAFD